MAETIKDKMIEQLKIHEGFRERVYQCTAGHDTVGYGYNLDANPLKLTNYEIVQIRHSGIKKTVAEYLLVRHAGEIETALIKQFSWFESLNEARKAVLINMTFNMGLAGLMGFKRTLRMIETSDFTGAAENMLKSKWATQVKGRAYELSVQMRTGGFK